MNLRDIFIFLSNILTMYYMFMSGKLSINFTFTQRNCEFLKVYKKVRHFIKADFTKNLQHMYMYILYKSFYYMGGQSCRWCTCNCSAMSDYSQDCPSFKNFTQQKLVQTFSFSSSEYTYNCPTAIYLQLSSLNCKFKELKMYYFQYKCLKQKRRENKN